MFHLTTLLSGQVLILNPLPYTYLQFLVCPCGLKRLVKSSWPWKCVWSPREQERGHVWPLIHCIVCQKLILARLRVLLLTVCEWMSEKLNMLSNVKLKTGLVLWLCHWGNVRFAVDPGNRRKGAHFSLRSCIQAHVCRWWAVIHWLCTNFHVAPCVKNNWCRFYLVAHSHSLYSTVNQI